MSWESFNNREYKAESNEVQEIHIGLEEVNLSLDAFRELLLMVNDPATYPTKAHLSNGLCANFLTLTYKTPFKCSKDNFLNTLFWNWPLHSGLVKYPIDDKDSGKRFNVQYLYCNLYSGTQRILRRSLLMYAIDKLERVKQSERITVMQSYRKKNGTPYKRPRKVFVINKDTL